MNKIRCIELTKDNYNKYIDQIGKLEELVAQQMEQEGRTGQFFTTGREGIEEYILSNDNTVMVALDNNDVIVSATYITQNQLPYTYNDITKYFKFGDEYIEYVKSSYSSQIELRKDMLKIYEIKLKAYEYAKSKILQSHPEYNGNIMDYLQNELSDKENEFHEKSELREALNTYMSEYIQNLSKQDETISELYDKFYWLSAEDISKEFNKEVTLKSETTQEYESLINSQRSQEYTEILQKGPLRILEKPTEDYSKYYNANTSNSLEIDTYITNPNSRQSGLARIIVYEGIKKHINRHFKNEENNVMYLCSTLHRENVSSKYVSEFFGLNDSLYVQRRNSRNREVHICEICRDNYKQYLDDMEDKIITLYDYNPNNKAVPPERKIKIIRAQLRYEEEQVENLRATSKCNYTGSFNSVERKTGKIEELKNKLKALLISKIPTSPDDGDRV